MKTILKYCLAVVLTGITVSASAQPISMELWPNRADHSHETPDRSRDVIRITDITSPSITVYPASVSGKPAPAVMVCPGGGYNILAINLEGTEIAEWLNSIGFTAVVLKYTVPKDRDAALRDAQRAMGLIRLHSTEWNIDRKKLGVLGFSAGGHLSARLSTTFETRNYTAVDEADSLSCRPDFTVLVYPAYLGDEAYNLPKEICVTTNTPSAFIVQAQDDTGHINSSIAYYLELKKQKIPAELHLFPYGGHGYGLRPSDKAVSHWPELCERWLKNTVSSGQ